MPCCSIVLLRLGYLGVTNVFALLRLLPMSDRDKDAEILALRHQLSLLQRQLSPDRVRFTPADRALLAALLHRLPRKVLRRLHLVVRPETVLRWHRDVIATGTGPIRASRTPGRSSHCPSHWQILTESRALTYEGTTGSAECFMSTRMPHELHR